MIMCIDRVRVVVNSTIPLVLFVYDGVFVLLTKGVTS